MGTHLHTMQVLMLAIVCGSVAAPTSFCFGQNEKDYWDQLINEREQMAVAAARANPVLVKKLNGEALRCLHDIQSELVQLAKIHSVLAGIEVEKPTPLDSRRSYSVGCKLIFMKNTRWNRGYSMGRQMANKDGIILIVSVNDISN